MKTVSYCAVRIALFLFLVTSAFNAGAITITYVNTGTDDGRVIGGWDNDSSGYLFSDAQENAFIVSTAGTIFGPLPPPGFPANFDAQGDTRAEMGTNLNSPLGTGVRSVFAPNTMSFPLQAKGQTLQATGVYQADTRVHSGRVGSTTPTTWIISVDPSGAEVAGTPVDVTVTGSIAGLVSVAGASAAIANWNVDVLTFGNVMAGSVTSGAISDSGSITFQIPLGTTFELLVDYNFQATGSGAGAISSADVTASLVEISAVIAPPVVPVINVNVLQPIGNVTTVVGPAGPFVQRRTIPVKFQLLNAKDGSLISDEQAAKLDVKLRVTYYKEGAKGVAIDPGSDTPDYAGDVRYDPDADHFISKLGTKPLKPGSTYQIEILVSGKPVGKAYFALK